MRSAVSVIGPQTTSDPSLIRAILVYLEATAPVAQRIRADGFYPLGRRFESCRGRYSQPVPCFGSALARDAQQLGAGRVGHRVGDRQLVQVARHGAELVRAALGVLAHR